MNQFKIFKLAWPSIVHDIKEGSSDGARSVGYFFSDINEEVWARWTRFIFVLFITCLVVFIPYIVGGFVDDPNDMLIATWGKGFLISILGSIILALFGALIFRLFLYIWEGE